MMFSLPQELSLPLLLGGLAAALVVLAVLFAFLRRLTKRRPAPLDESALRIDIASLSQAPRPEDGPQIEVYHVPVRLAAVVLAPAGRGRQVPPLEIVANLLDEMAPGLAKIIVSHQPAIRRWPEQLSTTGFSQRFFQLAQLPGDGGKGTPWCQLAGRFETRGGSFLAGLVCRSDEPNNFAQLTIDRPTGWLDVVRIRQ